ncbi:MAG TPA: hypothetical protein VHH73_17660, partial [Verrucomicrobiae bacterium]|nr:hypothetical protein [Verrucomicrobiae bacterium]
HLVFSDRPPQQISMRYSRRDSYEYRSLRKNIQIDGELFASWAILQDCQDRADHNFLDGFFACLDLQNPEEEDRAIDHEFVPATWVNEGGSHSDVAKAADALQKLNFSAKFAGRIDLDDAILECECTETVTYSGTRWVSQPLPDGPDVVQDCGIQAGRRVVGGTVSASTRAIAEAWTKRKRLLLE